MLSMTPSAVLDGAGQVLAGFDNVLVMDLAEPDAAGAWDPEACTTEVWGQQALLDDFVPPYEKSMLAMICGLHNALVTFTVEVKDLNGARTASDEVHVRLVLDVDNLRQCRRGAN
jgi:hypothetical protein